MASRLEPAFDFERDHPPKAGHLPPGQVALRMVSQAWIKHPSDLAMSPQELRDQPRVAVVLAHPDGERLDPAQHQPGIHRPWHAADRVLQERQPLEKVVT